MKKLLAMLLVLAMLFSMTTMFTACGIIGKLGHDYVMNSGIVEKNTIAATVGSRELNAVELNYYYIDAINNFYDQWTQAYSENADVYLKAIYGLDSALPLSQQWTDEAKTQTWADYFIEMAIGQAQNDYAMYDLAVADNFSLSADKKASLDDTIQNMDTYAAIYGYKNADQYLSAIYGKGATLETYSAYYERSLVAAEYYTAYEKNFVYTNEQREQYQADKKEQFNSYSYTSCYLSYTDFRDKNAGGEDGETFTEEQNNEARKKAEETAKELVVSITNAEDLKEKVKAAPVAAGKSLTVREEKDVFYKEVSTDALRNWLADPSRKVGDIAAIPKEDTVTDEDGTQTTVVNGYHVVIFNGVTENMIAMADIAYIFFSYEGGVEDESTGDILYSDADRADTRTVAQMYLTQWTDGERTAASMEELANKLIADKKAEAGGMVENLNPDSDFADGIIEWALRAERRPNEATIVEADNGFYLLCYAKKSALNYRHYMIDTEMRAKDYAEWYENVIKAVPTSILDTSKIDMDFVLSPR